MRFFKASIFWIANFFLVSQALFGQQEAVTSSGVKVLLFPDGTWVYADSLDKAPPNINFQLNLEWPFFDATSEVVHHKGFSLRYMEAYEQADWVAYLLTQKRLVKLFERSDNFRADPNIKTGSANDADYKGSGFDRGHLAPAADMSWSFESLSESFFYSNMSPQVPSFNRGVWKRLETQVRDWASLYDSLYVVTGPVLTNGLQTIGPNRVAIPNYYYKVALRFDGASPQAIAFIVPNASSSADLKTFVVTVDSLERLVGLDLYHQLPDALENIVEAQICLDCWDWQSRAPSKTSNVGASTSTQCLGTTKAGARCKSRTTHVSGFCHVHINQWNGAVQPSLEAQPEPQRKNATSTQCSGTTKAGNRCKRLTRNANGRCFQHGGA